MKGEDQPSNDGSPIFFFTPQCGTFNPEKNIKVDQQELHTHEDLSIKAKDEDEGLMAEGDICYKSNQSGRDEADQNVFKMDEDDNDEFVSVG